MIFTGLKLLAVGATLWVLLSLYERASVYPLDASQISPSSLGLSAIREVDFAANGQTLVLWVAEPEEEKPVILYFHGNAGNLANRAERFARITEQGYGLVAMAYRGSGGSSGRPSEKAITEDVTALYDRISEILPENPPANVIIYGESLGTGVAVRLVSLRPQNQPRAVILEAPYTSIPDVARHHMPWTRVLSWKMTNRWETKRHITTLHAPLLILHGERDQVIPFEQGNRVFERASSKDKTFHPVAWAGHDNLWCAATVEALWQFIDTQSPEN